MHQKVLMKKSLPIILLCIGISAAIAAYLVRQEPWISADTAFLKGDAAFKNGNYALSFHYFKKATDKKPKDSRFAWTATQMAALIGNVNAAYLYAQRTWKNGRKELDVANALVQYSFFSERSQKLAYALSLVKQMEDSIDKDDLSANFYLGFGETQKAQQLWEHAFSRNPQPVTACKLARTYLQEGNDSLAFSFLSSCRAQQKLDDEGYGILAQLYAKKGNTTEAEVCYQEGAAAFQSSGKLQYDHIMFLMDSKNFDRAASMLDSLIKKYPDVKTFETMRIWTLLTNGDYDGALRECDKSTAPINQIAYLRARALIKLNRLSEAETAYDSALNQGADLKVLLEYGNFLLYGLRKPDKARSVFMKVHKTLPLEPVANLGLAALAIDTKDASEARKYVEPVLSDKKNSPYAYLLLAQINLLEGKPKDAIDNCNKVPETIHDFEKTIFVKSQAFAALGHLDTADMLLTSLVQHTQKGQNIERAKRALIPLKIKEKKYGEAISIVNDLDNSIDPLDLGRIRLEIYALSGNLAMANKTLETLKNLLDKNDLHYYQSWLAELSGDTVKAAALLEPDLSLKSMFLRWADLRLKMGKTEAIFEKAPVDSLTVADWSQLAVTAQNKELYALSAQCYKHALEHDDGNAILLNNYAWACMQIPGFDQEDVLKAVKKAYTLLSNRIEVVQTYAEALNKCNKPEECIEILKSNQAQTKQNAALLYQLGIAYEKIDDLHHAVNSFRMILNFPDSTPDWPAGVSRGSLQSRIDEIKQKVGK